MKKKIAIIMTTLTLISGFSIPTFANTINVDKGVNLIMDNKKITMTGEQENIALRNSNDNNNYSTKNSTSINDPSRANLVTEAEKGYTFELNENVERTHITYDNRYGIEISADMYMPKNMNESQKYPAIVIAGPFGAVKEQAAGLYANQLASYGFVTIAFDPSFCGESGGKTRNMASPEIFTEDYSAAVDYLGLQSFVDHDRIGAVGICGLSGMAVTAAGTDTRIKAIATASMYDMSRDMSAGHEDYYTEEQRQKIMDYLSQQRWEDAESGSSSLGPHEVSFDEDNNPITSTSPILEELPEGTDAVTTAFFNYYVKRAYNPRAVNFVTSWTATTPMSFFEFPLMNNIKDISPRSIMFIAGENAHSRYYSEDAYKAAGNSKELVIVPNADHVDLYDNMEKIPFDKLVEFFNTNLK